MLNKKEKASWAPTFISLCFSTVNTVVTSCLKCCRAFSIMMEHVPLELGARIGPSSLKLLYQVFFDINRKVTD